MAKENKEVNYVNFNGISNNLKFHHDGKDGKPGFTSIIIKPVLYKFSKSGSVSITIPDLHLNKFVHPVKDNPEKFNVCFFEDWKLSVSIATYYDKNDKSKTKYENKDMTAKELQNEVIKARKTFKDKKAEAPAEEAEAEAEGPEFG